MPLTRTLEKLRDASTRGVPVTIVAFGDSNTETTWHTHGRMNWPALLAEALFEAHGNGAAVVINSGRCGGSFREGLTRLEHAVLRYQPDLVIIAFGMNDATRGLDGLADFEADARATIAAIRKRGTAEILIRTPNPVVAVHGLPLPPGTPPGTPWYNDQRPLAAYVEALRRVAASTGCDLCDHYKLWTERVFSYRSPVANPTALWPRMGDAIHPNHLGHLVFYRELAPHFNLPLYFPWEDAPAESGPGIHRSGGAS